MKTIAFLLAFNVVRPAAVGRMDGGGGRRLTISPEGRHDADQCRGAPDVQADLETSGCCRPQAREAPYLVDLPDRGRYRNTAEIKGRLARKQHGDREVDSGFPARLKESVDVACPNFSQIRCVKTRKWPKHGKLAPAKSLFRPNDAYELHFGRKSELPSMTTALLIPGRLRMAAEDPVVESLPVLAL
jgi:hypothetical protein